MSQEPERWLDRFAGACATVFIGALALYGAIWLLRAIWPELAIVATVTACLAGLVAWIRGRRGGW